MATLLKWTNHEQGITEFRVSRLYGPTITEQDVAELIATLPGTASSYLDLTTTNGLQYSYSVQSVKGPIIKTAGVDFGASEIGDRTIAMAGASSLNFTRHADSGTRTDGVVEHFRLGRSFEFDGGVYYEASAPLFPGIGAMDFDLDFDFFLNNKTGYLIGTIDPYATTPGWWMSVAASNQDEGWLEFGVRTSAGTYELVQAFVGAMSTEIACRARIEKRGKNVKFVNTMIGRTDRLEFTTANFQAPDSKMYIGGTPTASVDRLKGYIQKFLLTTYEYPSA